MREHQWSWETLEKIASEIQEIMRVYREQEAAGDVGTPGGLEHMGDVWKLLARWDRELNRIYGARE